MSLNIQQRRRRRRADFDNLTIRGGARYVQRFINPVVKVCLLGDMGVGKTSLSMRFVEDLFMENYRPSIGVCHFSKFVADEENGDYTVLVWDTAGTERYKSVNDNYLRGAGGCLLVFDINNKESFEHLVNHWYPYLMNQLPDVSAAVVANKVDQDENFEDNWACNIRDAVRFCKSHKLPLIRASAKEGWNVDYCFTLVDRLNHLRSPATTAMKEDEGESDIEDSQVDNFIDSIKLTELVEIYKSNNNLRPKPPKKDIFGSCCSIL